MLFANDMAGNTAEKSLLSDLLALFLTLQNGKKGPLQPEDHVIKVIKVMFSQKAESKP